MVANLKSTFLLTLTTLTLAASIAPAWSEGTSQNLSAKNLGASNSKRATEKLDSMPDFPNLPQYTGQTKFVDGSVQPAGDGVTVYQINVLAKEDLLQILDWYKQVLSGCKWQIQFSGKSALVANHPDGHTCAINLNTLLTPVYKTRLTIHYRNVVKSNKTYKNDKETVSD